MDNPKKLKKAVCILLEHKKDMDIPYNTYFNIFGIKKGIFTKKNLKLMLLPCLQARAGPKLSLKKCKQAMSFLNKNLDIKKFKSLNGSEKFNYFYNIVKSIPSVGPKITGVYMKDVIYHNNVCPDLVNYLYLPIDIHVRRILIEKLKIFTEEEVPKVSERYETRKNQKFQKILDEIHKPRVEFDYLWFIGKYFCNQRLACSFCFLKDLCLDKYYEDKSNN